MPKYRMTITVLEKHEYRREVIAADESEALRKFKRGDSSVCWDESYSLSSEEDTYIDTIETDYGPVRTVPPSAFE